jgi:LysR family transcriptional activator of nhaA
LRAALDHWFAEQDVKPEVVAECEDSALLKLLGHDGLGFFPAPANMARELVSLYGVGEIGRASGVHVDVVLVTCERRTPHPALGRLSRPLANP